MIAFICSKIVGATLFALAIPTASAGSAQSANPSFDCAKASKPDERVICGDDRLAELDQAVSIAFGQAVRKFKDEARKIAAESLAARHACGTERLCILDQQVKAIEEYADLGSSVPVPAWVGTYRAEIFTARGKPPNKALPKRVGQCAITKIAGISTRFGDELKKPADETDSSGSAVTYANDGYQVSYSYIQALADSHIGDEVLLCLSSIPENCPPGDIRGRMYSATNLRTKGSWLLPDSQHMCGGA
jgi:uncharacterized protein